MAEHGGTSDLINVVILLGAAVVAVPLFRRLGLGSVLGYLAAGLVIGPFGIGVFSDPAAILHVAELGVVMFLFIIGLEMRPSRLWSLRHEIFGLGAAQVAVCGAALTGVGLLAGLPLPAAFIGGAGFVLTSTAVVMQMLAERNVLGRPAGQQIVAVLLFEDLLIVPLLAVVAVMAPMAPHAEPSSRWIGVGMGLSALAALFAAGLWLLDPLFRILARSKAQDVMTAAALLVVLGAALLMQAGGLSMAMGAFAAGVLLSESSFRHQLEAEVEPFRGLLLGLFFLGVGMSLDVRTVAAHWAFILGGVAAMMAAKSACIYLVARLLRSSHADALDRAVLMAQGGEFAFVLYAAAAAAGVIADPVRADLTAIVVLSMALTPLAAAAQRRLARPTAPSAEGLETAQGVRDSVLVIGFGRFGQIATQNLLAAGVPVTLIETSTQAIRDSWDFGFKVYYGDGTQLHVLRAAGAGTAKAILVCVDHPETADRIVQLAKSEFPHARLLVRARDREHALALVAADVDYQVRETFESAMAFGHAALLALGRSRQEADRLSADVRERDAERFRLEIAGGIYAGRSMVRFNVEQRVDPP
ncbi:monovalent cation:proton antiporter-2 (CPA2) family protein [Pigmentiphaga soli]|uniref:Monovalent cation:proton antiporter-2 (CPA2) family protein n=1 Tax=Pigmentiphaga soli TaxID=1007095 RepID=A0ABP8H7X7_9BURK